jgi:hypothetical protein
MTSDEHAHPDDATWERMICEESPADERERVLEHVLECRECAEIYRALLEVRREAAAFDPGAVRAPAPRPDADAEPSARRSSARWYALAASIVLVAGVTALLWRPRPVPSAPPSVGTTPAIPPAPALADLPAFRLEPAPVMLSSSGLTPRGESAEDRKRFIDALGEALTPYRTGNFAEAARRLERLSETYSERVEPSFYAGVSYLLSQRPAEAVIALERARAHAPSEFLDEIDWQLGLAYVHAGQPTRARVPLQRVCGSTGRLRDRACEANRVIAGRQ